MTQNKYKSRVSIHGLRPGQEFTADVAYAQPYVDRDYFELIWEAPKPEVKPEAKPKPEPKPKKAASEPETDSGK